MRSRALKTLAILLLALTLTAVGFGYLLSGPGHRGPPTTHFDGTQFHNLEPTPLPSFSRALASFRELTNRSPWETWREVPAPPALPARVGDGAMRATFVNHATVLVQFDGVNVLTDPIWSERCSAVSFAGPARHHAPGIPFASLPPIHIVLISHDHYDHLDIPTLQQLQTEHAPTFVVGLGNRALLERHGITNVVEIDWLEGITSHGLSIHGEPTRHFSGRGLFDRQHSLWLGFWVSGPSGTVYVAGDTGYGSHFAATAARHGPVRLALLPIGAYAPRDFMGPIHMDPEQAVQAHQDVQAATSIGIHFGTFQLTTEAQDAPAEELAVARERARLPPQAFRVPSPGESFLIP